MHIRIPWRRRVVDVYKPAARVCFGAAAGSGLEYVCLVVQL